MTSTTALDGILPLSSMLREISRRIRYNVTLGVPASAQINPGGDHGPLIGACTFAPVPCQRQFVLTLLGDGNPDAKNKRSSATGLAQFLDETWLRLIRTHRPDLVITHSESEILKLRRDADLAREIAARFTEGNAEMLRRRGLPVTPGTLYLAHFAGGAGAVAILLADEQADAASTMASADASGRTTREKLVRANPFLERLTVADLKTWADRKMRVRPL